MSRYVPVAKRLAEEYAHSSLTAMAKRRGCRWQVVRRMLDRHGIQSRRPRHERAFDAARVDLAFALATTRQTGHVKPLVEAITRYCRARDLLTHHPG